MIGPGPAAISFDARLRQRRPARAHQQPRPAFDDRQRVERARNDVGAQNHAGAAAGRRVVDAAVAIGRRIADVARLELPETGGLRLAGEARAQRSGKHVGEERENGCSPHGHASALIGIVALDFIGQHDGRALADEIDRRHHCVRERQQLRLAAVCRCDFDDIARAEIVHGDDASERVALLRDRGKADQVGVIEFVVLGRGQFFTRDIELEAVQLLGSVARVDALDARDEMILGRAGRGDLESPLAVLRLERAVACDRQAGLR